MLLFQATTNINGKLELITPEGIQLIFGTKKNYMENFLYLHEHLTDINNIIDINEITYTPKQIIEQYKFKNKCSLDSIKNNELLFGNLLLDLRNHCNLSLRDMASLFGISKDKLNKYIHKVIDLH